MKYTLSNPSILWLLLFILFCNHSNGQVATFSFKYATSWDEVPTHSIETSDGGFIISAKQGDMNNYSFHALFIRLNKWGDTIKTSKIYNSTGNCFIYELLCGNDGNYFATGTWQQSPVEMNFWLVKLNSNLDILWEKKYVTACYNIDIALGLIDHSGMLNLYGNGNFGSFPNNVLLIYQCNQNGDSLGSVKLIQSSYHAVVNDMAEKSDLSGYYLLIDGRFLINTNSWGQILKFDTGLNLLTTDSIPRQFFQCYNLLTIGSKIIVTGMKPNLGLNPLTNKLGLLQLDTAYHVLAENYIGPDDTVSYPGYIHNLAMIDTINMYYGGTLNQDNNAIFSSKKTWFILGKYDTWLNVKWQKYYGGDLNYGLWSLGTTSDGGCLMAGSTFDDLTQNNERDIYIVKVDSSGIITGIKGDKMPLMHDALIYPNPGTDYLMVESGPQVSGASLLVVDIKGKQIINKKIMDSNMRIDTRLLPPGTYPWQMIYKNQIIESGCWIKH
jgi:hypothetical protein